MGELGDEFRGQLSLRLKRLGQGARRLGEGVLGLALPPTCVACGRVTGDAGGLCGACWSTLAFITPPYCERTGAPFLHDIAGAPGAATPRLSADAVAHPPAFDRARAAVLFTDVARDLVHDLKYADRLDVAAPMARLMALAGRELIAEADLIVPVPLHPLRLWRRRFNQAALLARHLAPSEGSRVRTDLLRRRRATPSQTRLGRQERQANVAGAFAPCGDAASALPGRRILLVDDVYTTGATLDACARALRRSGAAHVDALTFARVVDFP
ncbi:ComF family protein [Xanthobacter sediminis]